MSEGITASHRFSQTDMVRFFAIASLSATISVLTVLTLARDPGTITPQLFYIPILYAAYFYQKKGLVVAGACAIIYELIGSFYAFPDPVRSAYVIGQGVLFVSAGAVVAHLAEVNSTSVEKNRELSGQIGRDYDRRRGVICTVAHELRTPLQPIFGYLDLLLQDRQKYGITEETGRILDRCLQSAERERQIINRMLEFSILESGKIRPDYAVVSIPSLFSSVIEAGGYLQKAEIATDIPPDLKFEADAGKLTLVIDSLLSNAITYSRPPRRIYIMYTPSPDHRFHSIAIRDNGIGISQTQLESIFEPFQLADSDKLSRKYDRIGLSLSIARKYIDMHGGYITVTSEVNNGSTFTIHLPRERPEGGAGNGA